jgi:hypothetical protein
MMYILCTQYEHIPFTLKENRFIMSLLCFIRVNKNRKFGPFGGVYENIDYLWYPHLIAIV